MTMSTTIAAEARETYIASRFDALERRFKPEVPADDYRLGAILAKLAPLPGKRILDLGCGKGRFARRLADLGAEVIGLDLSASMMAAASGIARVQGSARHLPFRDATFDAVIAVEVFEHLIVTTPPIQEARRVIRPGGSLLIVDKNLASLNSARLGVPNLLLKWVDEYRGRWMYPLGGPVRERWFWPPALRRELARAFDHVAVDYLLDPSEAPRRIFREFPALRRMTLWSATVSKGVSP